MTNLASLDKVLQGDFDTVRYRPTSIGSPAHRAGIKAAIGASSGIGGAVRSLGRYGALLEVEFLFQVLGADA